MKKILLGTTGLVGAALLATAASAETPKVTLGGFSDFQAGYTSDDQDAALKHYGFRNDNTIVVKVDGKSASGLGYGAQIDLEADVSDDDNNQGTNAARTFTYLEGGFGRVELGSNKSVAATQRIDASTIAVATGGINGSWNQFVSNNGHAVSGHAGLGGNFISNSKLPSEHGNFAVINDETTYNATKVSYYTPKFAGFQAGVSYTPQLNDRGQALTRSDTTGLENVWDFGLGYETTWNAFKIGLAGTYERAGDTGGAAGYGLGTDDVSAWNAGAMVGWAGFSVAGSYGHLGDSGITGVDGHYWTAGLGYSAGPIGLSATYLDSTMDGAGGDDDFRNVVLGADYKLAPGLTPYAEVAFYDFDGPTGPSSNSGTTVILGTQVAF